MTFQQSTTSASSTQPDAVPAPRPCADAAGAVRCPCCQGEQTQPFFHLSDVPVFCNVLHESAAAARAAARAGIDLHHCQRCGMIHNARFDSALVRYADGYENSLYASPCFRGYADSLIAELAARRDLAGKLVVEIGCGDGRFLRALCRATGARGVGFDPSAPADLNGDDQCRIRRSLFTPEAIDEPVHLILSRHVLEHIHDPLPFLRAIRTAAAAAGATLFFEVPNALWTLRDGGVWDIIYEHCSYFTPRSLAVLFQRAGLEVHDVRSRYGDQFLTIDADVAPASSRCLPPLPSPPAPPTSTNARALISPDEPTLIETFSPCFHALRTYWRAALDDPDLQPAVIWGAGSKGVTFLNAVDPAQQRIAAAIDLNPRKHNRFIPVTAHPVLPPEALPELNPRTIIVMNPLYETEIRQTAANLNLRTRIVSAQR